jgi:putative membrane protein
MSFTLRRFALLTVAIVVFFSGLAFYLRNDQPVVFDYFLGETELSFSVWLLIALLIGVVLGWLAILPLIFSMKRQNARLQRRLKVSETEINNLRVLPVKETH